MKLHPRGAVGTPAGGPAAGPPFYTRPMERTMRRILSAPLVAGALLGLTAAGGAAQQEDGPIRGFAGIDLFVASPTGEFAENVGTGGGLGLHGRLAFDDAGIFSLRGDVGFINYGNETIRICVTQPCRVTGDLTTSNNIFFGGIGPEIGAGTGGARAYANASAGFAYFSTTSSVEGANNQGQPFASSTNFDDATFAWMAGGACSSGCRQGGCRYTWTWVPGTMETARRSTCGRGTSRIVPTAAWSSIPVAARRTSGPSASGYPSDCGRGWGTTTTMAGRRVPPEPGG
jgi:hypothetical protein